MEERSDQFLMGRYYVPILRGEWVNIKTTEPESKGRDEYSFALKIMRIEEWLNKEIEQNLKIKAQLYSAKKYLPEFITKWKEFLCQFDSYSVSCLRIAKKLKEEIKNRIKTPLYKRADQFYGENHWIQEHDLAVAAFDKSTSAKLRDNLEDEKFRGVNLYKLKFRGTICAQGDKQEIENIKETVTKLAEDYRKNPGVIALINEARKLESYGEERLKDELKRLS